MSQPVAHDIFSQTCGVPIQYWSQPQTDTDIQHGVPDNNRRDSNKERYASLPLLSNLHQHSSPRVLAHQLLPCLNSTKKQLIQGGEQSRHNNTLNNNSNNNNNNHYIEAELFSMREQWQRMQQMYQQNMSRLESEHRREASKREQQMQQIQHSVTLLQQQHEQLREQLMRREEEQESQQQRQHQQNNSTDMDVGIANYRNTVDRVTEVEAQMIEWHQQLKNLQTGIQQIVVQQQKQLEEQQQQEEQQPTHQQEQQHQQQEQQQQPQQQHMAKASPPSPALSASFSSTPRRSFALSAIEAETLVQEEAQSESLTPAKKELIAKIKAKLSQYTQLKKEQQGTAGQPAEQEDTFAF